MGSWVVRIGGGFIAICVAFAVYAFLFIDDEKDPEPRKTPSAVSPERGKTPERSAVPAKKPKPKAPPQPTTPAPPAPTERDVVIWRALWDLLNKTPPIDEDVAVKKVARRFKVKLNEVNEANVKVEAYKQWSSANIETAVRANAGGLHGKVEQVTYEPTQEAISIKMQAKAGLTEGLMKKAIRRDLIIGVRAGFTASPAIRKVSVWVVAPLSGSDLAKVASVDVGREEFSALGTSFFASPVAKNAKRLNPWYSAAFR